MLLLSLLLQASALAPGVEKSECERSVARMVAAVQAPNMRAVITFTGTQTALLPLDELVSAPPQSAESTLFPIGKDSFVLTVEVRADHGLPRQAMRFADVVCRVGTSTGGRFNGVMSFTGGRVTDAEFARIAEK